MRSAEISGAHIAADSWGHFLAPASDCLCHGPTRGRNVTFVRCDRWVVGWRPLDARTAQLEVCRRYLATYGPARRDELEHWLAWTLPDDVWNDLDLEEVDVEGYRTFVLRGDVFPERGRAACVSSRTTTSTSSAAIREIS